MKKLIILSFLFCFSITQSQTKGFQSINEAKENTKIIATAFINTNYDKLFNKMKPYWGIDNAEIDSLIIKTKNFQPYFDERLGNGINTVKIKEQDLENVLFKEVYILRYEKSALRIEMVYYRGSLGWVINSFTWDDKFLKELE